MATSIPSTQQIWAWLQEVSDPEIPAISVVDLGIVRDLCWTDIGDQAELVVTITPTYSGCPATQVIADDIAHALRERGIQRLQLKHQIAPPWTTDWITEQGHQRLREFGIAPPVGKAADMLVRRKHGKAPIECPRCGSSTTLKVSEFGSTPCKAHYKCQDCLEPFDYFKCL